MCRTYWLAFISLTTLMLAGCARGGQAAAAKVPAPQAAVEPSAPAPGQADMPPTVQIAGMDGARIDGKLSSTCWGDWCVDGGFEVEAFQPVPEGPITLYLNEPMPEALTLMLFAGVDAFYAGEIASSIEIAPDALTVTWEIDAAPGSYVLMVFSAWEQGDATTLFGVTLP